jgi:ASPIC and UnbV
MQEVNTGYGYASGQPAICHFGVGDTDDVDLRVDLPNGQRIQRTGLPSTASS